MVTDGLYKGVWRDGKMKDSADGETRERRYEDEMERGEKCGRDAETTISISAIKATLTPRVEGQTVERWK